MNWAVFAFGFGIQWAVLESVQAIVQEIQAIFT